MLFLERKIYLYFSLGVVLFALVGCGNLFKKVEAPEIDCYSALANDLDGLEDTDVARLLEKSQGPEDGDCWLGLMECCLRKARDIPRAHLVRGIGEFNHQKHKELFHLTVSRYLTEVALGHEEYRQETRALLEAYIRLLINHSDKSSDPDLRNAQLLCRRLDAELYRRFFE